MFYQAISQNKTKTFFLMVVFMLVIIAIGWAAGQLTSYGNALMFPAFILAFIMVWASYYYSDKMVIASVGAHPADKIEEPYLNNVVEGLAIAAGFPAVPACYIMESPALNAFATGRDPKHAAICVTRGLLERLNRQELEGVIAHEMSHIRNYDTLIMTIAAVLVSGVALLSQFLWRSMFWGGGRRRDSDRNGGGLQIVLLVVALVLLILSPILVTLMQLALSRNREYLADASAVQLTRNPEGLISALKNISTDQEPLEGASKATAHLFISNPLKNVNVNNLFSTHPPIEKRIAALEKM
jgi:heat shock protein HtpX